MEFTVGLSNTLNPDNAAAIMRVMASFGYTNLLLIKERFNRKDVNYAIARGGYGIIESARSVASLESVKGQYDVIIGTSAKESGGNNIARSFITLEEAKDTLRASETELDSKNHKVLLLFGSEDKGLSKDELELCDFVITIPTLEVQRALNLSHSAAIVLHYLDSIDMPQNQNSSMQKRSIPASGKEKETIVAEAVSTYEYANKKNGNEKRSRKKTQELVWRRIIGKSMMTRTEARTILGFLSEIRRAMKNHHVNNRNYSSENQ